MQKNFLWVFTLSALILLNSCKPGGNLGSAEKSLEKEQYNNAMESYKRAYTSTKDKQKKAEIAYKIAEILRLNRDYVKAEGWYRKAATGGYSDAALHYNLGEVLKMNERYEDAIKEFEEYKKNAPGDPHADEQIELSKAAMDWKKNPKTRFVVENFKKANSPQNDFAPMLAKDGLYFSSDREGTTGKKTFGRTGGRYSDIFYVEKKAQKRGSKTFTWGDATLIPGEVNSMMNEGTPTFDEKGNTMYYTQCNGTKGDSIKNCVVMMARKRGKDWTDPTVLPFCNDTTVDYGHPSISPDGQRLVFASDEPNGKGKHDLYISTYVKRSRTWSDPINLGDIINTTGEELFPYFLNDTTLYFASDGHIGMGGMDIFVSYGKHPDWKKPVNLKYPVNSGGDDFGITFEETGDAGFFTSNRPKSQGDDIYSFYLTPLVFTLSGVVYNANTNQPVPNATVILENKKGEKKEAKTDDNGKYFYKLDKSMDYEVKATKKNFFNSAEEFKTTVGLEYSADLTQDLVITPQEVTLELKGIYYDLDKADLRPESEKTLDSLANILVEIPYITIEVGSHTDCRASMEYNDDLSQRRAKSVVDYLVDKKGIDADRLVAKGYGERQLKTPCPCEGNEGAGLQCTEEQHQENRRTEVKVLSNNYVPKNK